MKKIGWLLTMGLIFLTFGCQSTEEVTLQKYFQAVKHNDRDTMASMAAEPIQIVYKSWKVLNVEPVASEPLPLVKLLEMKDQMKKQRDEELQVVQQKKESQILLEQKIADTKNRREKAELEKELPKAKEELDKAMASFRKVLTQYQNIEKEIKMEKKIFSLSTGIPQEQAENFTNGSIETSVANVQVTTPDNQTKLYKIYLRKYIIEAVGAGKRSGRLVIIKFETE